MRQLFTLVCLSCALVLFSCGGEKKEDTLKNAIKDVKTEVKETAKKVEDSSGKVDVDKLEKMMDDNSEKAK